MSTPPCPACSAPGLTLVPGEGYKCRYCGKTFGAETPLCPQCGWPSLAGTERCHACGEPLSLVEHVLERRAAGQPAWLERARRQAGDIKRTEERASWRRMQDFVELDRRRQAELLLRQETQRRRARRTYVVAAIGLALLATLIVTYLLLTPF